MMRGSAAVGILVLVLGAGCPDKDKETTPVRPASGPAAQLKGVLGEPAKARASRVNRDHLWRELGRAPSSVRGPRSLQPLSDLRNAFPDWEVRPSYVAEQGNMVLIEGVAQGTHRGPFGKRAATGRKVGAHVAMLAVVDEGVIVETLAYLGTDIYDRQVEDSPARQAPPIPSWPTLEERETGRKVKLSQRMIAEIYGLAANGAASRLLGLLGRTDMERTAFDTIDLTKVSDPRKLTATMKTFFDPLRVVVRSTHVLGKSVTATIEIQGTLRRPLQSFRAGQKIQAEAMLVAHVDGDHVRRGRFYFDGASVRPAR